MPSGFFGKNLQKESLKQKKKEYPHQIYIFEIVYNLGHNTLELYNVLGQID